MFRKQRLFTGWVFASAVSAGVLAGTTTAQAGSATVVPQSSSETAGATAERPAPQTAEAVLRAREDLTIAAYDLNLQIEPATRHLAALARLTVRNHGERPLEQIALQISSGLEWRSVSSEGAKLPFTSQRLDTDADHTGAANEALVRLPHPIVPGQSLPLVVFYIGSVERTFDRLSRIDIPQPTAEAMDWDRIEPGRVALRGFGNVLWYPVAAPPVLLGQGAALEQEAGRQKLREQQATAHLRLSMTYTGPAPAAVYFCGRPGSLSASAEQTSAVDADAADVTSGVATAEFAAQPLGFRPMSLFVFPTGSENVGDLLQVLGGSADERNALRASADEVAPLLTDWLGVKPDRRLTVAVQDGESFADSTFVVASASALEQRSTMAGALTPAWMQSAEPWLDRAIPQLMSLLWIERKAGRSSALAQIVDRSHALSLADQSGAETPGDMGLLNASTEIALDTKSLAVLWMLRSIAGDEALKQAFQRLRLDATLDRDPHGFQRALEQTSGKQLGWFFTDWVDHDRGLPDLTIVSVTPHSVAEQTGRQEGSLVSVEVQNRGGAVAEIPVTVRSGALTATERLRVPARSIASVRVLFQGTPQEVQVNDGSVPEVAESVHLRRLTPVQP